MSYINNSKASVGLVAKVSTKCTEDTVVPGSTPGLDPFAACLPLISRKQSLKKQPKRMHSSSHAFLSSEHDAV